MSVRDLLTVRFRPTTDLWAVLISCVLVTASLAAATFVVGAANGGGYFLVYALCTALVCGIGVPTWWMVWHRKRSLADLGITTRRLLPSIALQLVFAAFQYSQTLAKTRIPEMSSFLPLVALALCVGLFEAVFWRGWVLQRLEESFGFIPAALLGSALYAVYHIGYGMPWSEMAFLFFIGLLYAAVFRITGSIFILWPVLQPMGQLVTLLKDGLSIPPIAVLGFGEVMLAMGAVLFIAHRREKKALRARAQAATAA